VLNVFACGTFSASGCEESIWVFLYAFLIPTLIAIGIGIGIVFILSSAISIITSAGNDNEMKEAWEKIKGGFIGLVILIVAFTIIQILINSTTGGVINSDISGSIRGS